MTGAHIRRVACDGCGRAVDLYPHQSFCTSCFVRGGEDSLEKNSAVVGEGGEQIRSDTWVDARDVR